MGRRGRQSRGGRGVGDRRGERGRGEICNDPIVIGSEKTTLMVHGCIIE